MSSFIKPIINVFVGIVFFSSKLFAQEVIASENSPGKRWGHASAYDENRDRIVLFGGAFSRTEMLGDTWEFDGIKWEKINVEGPGKRGYSAMTYDKGRNKIILHGGRNDERVPLKDTWEWDGMKWTKLSEEGPGGRDHHDIVYDESRKVITLFGGWDGKDVTGDTWEWDGNKWTLVNSGGPNKRAAYSMAYDSDRKTIIIYGGLWMGGLYADLWEWDGRKWIAISEPYDHYTLDHHESVYDKASGNILFFGGKNFRITPQNRLLILKGGEIEILNNGDGPSPRYNTTFVYDTKRNRSIIYGGRIRNGEDFISLGETWSWESGKWVKLTE